MSSPEYSPKSHRHTNYVYGSKYNFLSKPKSPKSSIYDIEYSPKFYKYRKIRYLEDSDSEQQNKNQPKAPEFPKSPRLKIHIPSTEPIGKVRSINLGGGYTMQVTDDKTGTITKVTSEELKEFPFITRVYINEDKRSFYPVKFMVECENDLYTIKNRATFRIRYNGQVYRVECFHGSYFNVPFAVNIDGVFQKFSEIK